MNYCLNCGNETTNPKFCSKNCAGIINNSLYPKRKTTKFCRVDDCKNTRSSWKSTLCSEHMYLKGIRLKPFTNNKRRERKQHYCEVCEKRIGYRQKYCDEHRIALKYNTLKDVRNSLAVKDKHPSWAAAYIRTNNRTVNKELLNLPCARCGYDKHVELCHIKPLAAFTEDALVTEINHRDNVIQLCRNCHWEMDHALDKIAA